MTTNETEEKEKQFIKEFLDFVFETMDLGFYMHEDTEQDNRIEAHHVTMKMRDKLKEMFERYKLV